MSIAEEIFETARKLPDRLQREALEFVRFLEREQRPPTPGSPEFTSELLAAFAAAKERALREEASVG